MAKNLMYLKIGFLISLAAVFGSLYFSDILGYPPCLLCWYQRICIYPLVLIFGTGLLDEDRKCLRYAGPLVVVGTLISTYHNLIYYGFVPESIAPCTQGVSCSTRQIEYFGIITIPLLSLAGFLTLACLIFVANRNWRKNEEK